MRIDDPIEAVDAVDRDDGVAGGDSVQEFLQNRRGQVVGLAVVGGQAYSSGQVLNRVEVADGPDVGQHPGEAHDAVLPSRLQCVRQRGRANKFERGVDPGREDVAYLAGNVAVVDQDVVRADVGEGGGLVRVARRCEHGQVLLLGEYCRCHAH